MVLCGIYEVKNIINNKCYIGSSKNINNRFYIHKLDLKNNKHHSTYLQNAYNKYGLKVFEFNIIEECDMDVLIKKEQFYLDNRNPKYNIAKFAGKPMKNCYREKNPFYGKTHSDEFKKLLILRNKGNKYHLGYNHSLETKNKISKIHKNNKYNEGRIQTDKVKKAVSDSNSGEKNFHAKLKKQDVIFIKNQFNNKIHTSPMFAKKYNVDKSTIRNIIKYKTWKNL